MLSKISPTPYPVLIVGAGPTGLSLANALIQLGIPIRIIELKHGLSETTKATNLMQGTQEKLAIYNLIAPMESISGKMSRMIMEGYHTPLGVRTMHMEESPFPDVLLLGQDNIERSLAQSLKKSGSEIEFNTRLIHLIQEKDRVRVSLKKEFDFNKDLELKGPGSSNLEKLDLTKQDFEEEKKIGEADSTGDISDAFFSYVVACDGPWGITRSFSDCNFTPIKTGKSIRQVDARLTWKRLGSMNQMWFFYFDKGFMVVVPLPEGYYRILSIEPSENIPDRKPKLEEMQNKLREVSGDHSLLLRDPKWFSHTELNMGIAPKLIDQRVILAGDAGNPILPNGGQGLNTGIQDSLNLAWKLASVWKGESKLSLLDTYNEERWSLRVALEKVQFNSLKYTTTPPKFMQWTISRFGNFLLDKGEIPMARAFSQLGIEYKKSNLSEKRKRKGIMAGERILTADILNARTHMEVSLFTELSLPVWKVLVFDGKSPLDPSIFQFLDNLQIPGLKTFIITASLETNYLETLKESQNLYYDIDLMAHKVYRIKKPAMFLIRPDNYIALVTQIMNGSELLNYRNTWFN